MPVQSVQGQGPICIALPYVGTDMQRRIGERLLRAADWSAAPDRYLDRVVSAAFGNATILRANFHRYLSDVDHAHSKPDQPSLQGMVGVVPLHNDEGEDIWSQPPSLKEASTWRSMFYAPYHAALAAEIARIRARHGSVLIVNFRAKRQSLEHGSPADMTDVDICSHMGSTCSIKLTTQISALMKSYGTFASSFKTRARAGWTIRHYGNPGLGVHAIDIDLNEACYLTRHHGESHYDDAKAARLQSMLADVNHLMSTWQADQV